MEKKWLSHGWEYRPNGEQWPPKPKNRHEVVEHSYVYTPVNNKPVDRDGQLNSGFSPRI